MINKKQIQENRERVITLLRSTERKKIENLVKWLDSGNFYTSPASTMFHGNFEGGLTAHSLAVYDEFDRQVKHYGFQVPQDSIIISSLGHDMCKTNFYIPNKLKSGNLSEAKPYKTDDNFPIGHGEKSVIILSKYIDLTDQESLIMRWHMGHEDPSWEDYKEKVEKQFPEVTLFQHVDKEVALFRQL